MSSENESLKLILDEDDEIPKMHPYGGYVRDSIFKEPEDFVYFDPIVDSQCRIPFHRGEFFPDEDEEKEDKDK